MLGYLLDAPAEARHRAGDWFLTGDSAVLRADGAIGYLGRGDDLLTSGGFRVSPLEVEAALADFPGLDEVAVADHALDPATRVIAAFYVAKAPLDEASLASHAAPRLAPYKRPRLYLRVDSLPRGANGKLLRRALRDAAADRTEVPDDQA
jgi:acyl-coenzyme A synthetase/AMP-(fatty) acid ligase